MTRSIARCVVTLFAGRLSRPSFCVGRPLRKEARQTRGAERSSQDSSQLSRKDVASAVTARSTAQNGDSAHQQGAAALHERASARAYGFT